MKKIFISFLSAIILGSMPLFGFADLTKSEELLNNLNKIKLNTFDKISIKKQKYQNISNERNNKILQANFDDKTKKIFINKIDQLNIIFNNYHQQFLDQILSDYYNKYSEIKINEELTALIDIKNNLTDLDIKKIETEINNFENNLKKNYLQFEQTIDNLLANFVSDMNLFYNQLESQNAYQELILIDQKLIDKKFDAIKKKYKTIDADVNAYLKKIPDNNNLISTLKSTLISINKQLSDKNLNLEKEFLFLNIKKTLIQNIYFQGNIKYINYLIPTINKSVENQLLKKYSTGSINTGNIEFKSNKGFTILLPKNAAYENNAISGENFFGYQGLNCISKLNLINFKNKDKLNTNPDLEIFECQSKSASDQLYSLLNTEKLKVRNIPALKKIFFMQINSENGKEFEKNIIININ